MKAMHLLVICLRLQFVYKVQMYFKHFLMNTVYEIILILNNE